MHSETAADWDWDSVLLLANLPWDAEGHGASDGADANSNEPHALNTEEGSNKKDPRLSCPNFLAGRVPCACTDNEGENENEGGRKRIKSAGRCQVPGCGASLDGLKGYHKRHRVCLACANAQTVMLQSGSHRYCQQCGKFHILSDFDEGKRSCRRKLERHNNRRRRKIPDIGIMELSQSSDKETKSSSVHLNDSSEICADGKATTSSALIEHQNMDHSVTRDVQADEQDSGLTPSAVINSGDVESLDPLQNSFPAREHSRNVLGSPSFEMHGFNAGGARLQNFPLDSRILNGTLSSAPSNVNDELPACHKSLIGERSLLGLLMEDRMELENPPHCQRSMSEGHLSEAGRVAYPSSASSSGFRRHSTYISPCPTSRISFKFYDWNPADFPRRLRQQILEWLANMPVELEGYIRSGCTILTLFVAMPQTSWDEVSADWSDQILQLVCNSEGGFWDRGMFAARLGNKVCEVENGKVSETVVENISLNPRLHNIHPLCLVAGAQAEITIVGDKLQQKNSRLIISSAGKCVSRRLSELLLCKEDSFQVPLSAGFTNHMRSLCFPFLAPRKSGSIYIEVDGPFGTTDFLPLLIADKEICAEIRTLEPEICITEITSSKIHKSLDQNTRSLLLDLGWVLGLNDQGIGGINVVDHLERLHRLFMFSVRRGWCATSKRLLQVAEFMGLLENVGLSDDGLTALHLASLHRHVNLAKLVMVVGSEYEQDGNFISKKRFWWHEDFPGPERLTPLHIAGLRQESGTLIDVMTKTERGLLAWEHSKDCNGKSPDDYAKVVCTSYHEIVHRNASLLLQSIGKPSSNKFSSLIQKSIPVQSVLVLEQQSCFPKKVFNEIQEENLRRIIHFFGKHFGALCRNPNMRYHSEMMRKRHLVVTTVSILAICAGVCIVLQHPKRIAQISASLRRCLGSQIHF